uniref:30S ribosomal protein S18 n=1 Tax=Heterorhabditis bacteriophora TaxID=37862 RepID=A0A1I7WUA7_HETBA
MVKKQVRQGRRCPLAIDYNKLRALFR